MTREEMKERMTWLEEREFCIKMVDRWTNEDRKMLDEIQREKEAIKKAMNE